MIATPTTCRAALGMLNLPDLKEERVEESATQYTILASCDKIPLYCCLAPEVVRNGSKPTLWRDLPMHGKHVIIGIERQRFICRTCKKASSQPLPGMSKSHMMTERLVAYIEKNSTERTFSALAQELGLNETTIRLIFRKYAFEQLKAAKIVTPKWMGLDELYLLRKFRGIVTNVQEKTIVELLKNRSKTTIIGYLSRIEDRKNIELVTIDMWNPYREAVNLILPDARIIVDKFHIMRMASEGLERIRKQQRLGMPVRQRLALKDDRWILLTNPDKLNASRRILLDTWILNYPLIGAGYKAKERFRGVWKASSRPEAEALYDEWQATLTDDIRPAFHDLTTAMANWRSEIFNYFDYRITNAYTESLNGLAKIINRLGRGYSFEVLRARLLLNFRYLKQAAPKVSREFPGDSSNRSSFSLFAGASKPEGRLLGIDISTLMEEQIPEDENPEINP